MISNTQQGVYFNTLRLIPFYFWELW